MNMGMKLIIDWQEKTQSQVEETVKAVALELRKEVCLLYYPCAEALIE